MHKTCLKTLLSTCLLGLVFTASADYEDGVNAALAGDYATASREFAAAAEAGLDLAQYNLGILYYSGQGVDQDFSLAFKWTEAAALQGHVDAQFNLGILYIEGTGVDEDLDQALSWLGRAARGGHAIAAFDLAMMYHQGDPVDKNAVLAHAWASQSVHNAFEDGQALKDEIEERMDPQQLSQARRLYATWQIEALPPILPAR